MKASLIGATIAGCALLAACGGTPADNVIAINDATAINAADAASVDDDVNAAIANVTDAPLTIAYRCEPAMALSVRYDNDAAPDGKAFVTLDGKDYALDHVQSGSGARYETQSGRTAGATLVWWNKGTDGMLMEGKAGDPAAEEKTIATCSQLG